jgi:hypothetical protein
VRTAAGGEGLTMFRIMKSSEENEEKLVGDERKAGGVSHVLMFAIFNSRNQYRNDFAWRISRVHVEDILHNRRFLTFYEHGIAHRD